MFEETGPIQTDVPPTDGPDVSEAQAALAQRLETNPANQPGVPAQVDPAAGEPGAPEADFNDFWGELYGNPEAQGGPVPSPQATFPQPQYGPPAGQGGDEEAILQFIQNEALDAVRPELERMQERYETDRRREGLAELVEEYPQLRNPETQQVVTTRLREIAERYGNKMLLTDPDLVEQVLLAEIGSRSLAEGTPASQVVSNQGGMEVGAGVSGADGSGPSGNDELERILGGGNSFRF